MMFKVEWGPTEAKVNIATGGPCARELPLTRPHLRLQLNVRCVCETTAM